MHVCFHLIQQSDRKIDDHDDEQEKQFAEDCFNQLTKKPSSTGCQVNRKNVEASVWSSGSD